ncbi:MAG: porin [Burkholderiales bacterium]|nr:porin [Burkholderiales bacterium]
MNFKKPLVALTMASLSAVACAESEVTLYGTVDAAVVVGKESRRAATVQLMDGVAGGSVWGIKGVEDLGNNWEVGFTLENGFTINDGAALEPGFAFYKQATLHVSSDFGTFAMGRMGTLASYEGTYSIWDASPFGTDYLQAGLNNIFNTGQIFNNTLLYVSPDFDGLALHLQYSNGTESDTNKWSKSNHYYAVGLTYEIGGLNLVGIIERFDYDKFADPRDKASMVYSLSAAYDFEVAKVYFGYQYANRLHTVDQLDNMAFTGKGASQNAFTLGTEVPAGGGTFKAAVNYRWGRAANDFLFVAAEDADNFDINKKKFSRFSFGVAYEYPLSKRTFVYGFGAMQKGWGAFSTADIKGDFNNWSIGMGLHHDF